ncbi:MAG: sugar ABC transporter permease [Firmicutes bacterium]|nr:sugar ABC transporter permease [Bacillota bacterium]
MVKKRRFKLNRSKLTPYILLFPWFIGIGLFRLYPILISFWYSLHEVRLLGGEGITTTWVGFDNFYTLLFRGGPTTTHFWESVRATLVYVILGTPAVLVVAFFVAFILNFKLKGVNLFRTAYYIPSILGGNVAVSIVWRELFSSHGPVNSVLGIFGVEPFSWLTHPTFAPLTLVFLSAWQFGSVMLIFLAALQNVSPTLYEAASIDGARKWRQLFAITLPIITPVVLFNTVNVLIRHFQAFNEGFLITQRGPSRATDFLNIMIYDFAFLRMQFGLASAITLLLLAAIGLLTAILFFSSKYWVHYND